MADNPYRAAFDASVEEVDELLKQLVEKKKFANLLATKAGVEPPFDDTEGAVPTALDAIKIDQFTSIGAPGVAARAYLERRGKDKGAATFEQVFDALTRGGYVFVAKGDQKAALKIAMGKDEKILRLPNDAYGLREWYGGAHKLDRDKKGGKGATEETSPEPTPDPPATSEKEEEDPE